MIAPAFAQVSIRPDHPDLKPAALGAMMPAAIADALLSPGHPRIVAIGPNGPLHRAAPPPGSPERLSVRLIAAPVLDKPSGFCVRHGWGVVTVAPGTIGQGDTIAPVTDYALPIAGRCGDAGRSFLTVERADRPRAFAVVQSLAAAITAAKTAAPGFPVVVDDREGRDMAAYLRAHPGRTLPRFDIITDPRAALAALPVAAISYVSHGAWTDTELLDPALLRDRAGRRRERWDLFAGGDWTVDLVLDGDRIAAIALRRAIPAPF